MSPEQFNAWRVVPRLMVAGYGVIVWDAAQWYQALPVPTNSQSAFISILMTTLPAVLTFYCTSGGK